jgi:hypothetical protein
MTIGLSLLFVAIYATIALEHPLDINKSAPALIGTGLLSTELASTRLQYANTAWVGH